MKLNCQGFAYIRQNFYVQQYLSSTRQCFSYIWQYLYVYSI